MAYQHCLWTLFIVVIKRLFGYHIALEAVYGHIIQCGGPSGILKERGQLPPCGTWLLQRGFTKEPFLGYTIRHHTADIAVYGDITAHMI